MHGYPSGPTLGNGKQAYEYHLGIFGEWMEQIY